MAVYELQQILKNEFWFCVNEEDENWNAVINFGYQLHEGPCALIVERKEEDKRYINKDEHFPKTVNIIEFSKLKEAKPVHILHCSPVDSTRSNCNCLLSKK